MNTTKKLVSTRHMSQSFFYGLIIVHNIRFGSQSSPACIWWVEVCSSSYGRWAIICKTLRLRCSPAHPTDANTLRNTAMSIKKSTVAPTSLLGHCIKSCFVHRQLSLSLLPTSFSFVMADAVCLKSLLGTFIPNVTKERVSVTEITPIDADLKVFK